LQGDLADVESVTSVWAGADWYEREAYDLFGVRFTKHPDLRRIMMPEGWEGHPLRRDFPTHGHKYSYQND
jgi:NADH:ubiquinone oxidoreductase subunit C